MENPGGNKVPDTPSTLDLRRLLAGKVVNLLKMKVEKEHNDRNLLYSLLYYRKRSLYWLALQEFLATNSDPIITVFSQIDFLTHKLRLVDKDSYYYINFEELFPDRKKIIGEWEKKIFKIFITARHDNHDSQKIAVNRQQKDTAVNPNNKLLFFVISLVTATLVQITFPNLNGSPSFGDQENSPPTQPNNLLQKQP